MEYEDCSAYKMKANMNISRHLQHLILYQLYLHWYNKDVKLNIYLHYLQFAEFVDAAGVEVDDILKLWHGKAFSTR